MDSPEILKIIGSTSPSLDSPPVQESPVFSYISDLSPIQLLKASHAVQGFPGLSSPPLVFTSPRINTLQETSFLKRPQYLQFSSAEKSKAQDEAKKVVGGSADSKKHINQLQMGLITDTQDCETNSSSAGVDEYLADPVEMDRMNSAQSVNPCLKESNNALKSEAPSEQAEEDLEGKQTLDAKPVKIKELTDGVLPSSECPKVGSGISINNAFNGGYLQGVHNQGFGGGHQDDCDHTPQSPPGHLQIGQVYDDCTEKVGGTSKGMIGNMILHAPNKTKNYQGGMHRRCLQFEEAPSCASVKRDSSSIEKVNNSKTPASTAELEIVKVSSAATSKRPMGASLPPRYVGISPLTVPKPSGIGLHLNSIVNTAPIVLGATRSTKLADRYIGLQVMKSLAVLSHHLSENVKDDTETSIAASSSITQFPYTLEFEHHGSPIEERKFDSQNVDNYKELNQSSSQKKRKKTPSSKDSDGCKRCNCKKTKCLKLYCDCFAAGVYCAETCACQGCFNIPDYEDTVLEMRQQIEARNPLAFAPKIGQLEEEIQFTPASARHKRGCNCKKSMCLKKYCECYQANVGCSSGCRCDGCKIFYGRKGEHGVTKDMFSDKAGKETFDEKLEMVATKKDILSTELYDSHNHTPLTPSFQCFNHANNVPKSLCLPTSYLRSPESDLTIISSYEKSTRSSLKNSETSGILLETSKELSDMSYYQWREEFDSIGIADTFSPRYDAAPTSCHITPLSDICSKASSSSTSSRSHWKKCFTSSAVPWKSRSVIQ